VPGPTPYTAKALNVVKMFAGCEDMCGATLGLVKAVFAAEGVDPKIRQTIILRAATVLNVPYEWQANVPMSQNNGLSEAEIAHIGTRGSIVGLSSKYALICTATDEMSTTGTLTDQTLGSLLESYGEVITRKLVLMIAWFNLLSLFLNGCRVPMEVTDKIGAKKSPLE
jgi:Carboxymuconolactone decarboxylase family